MPAVSVTGARHVRRGGIEVIRRALQTGRRPLSLSSGAQYGVDTELALLAAEVWPLTRQIILVPDAPHNEELVPRLRGLLLPDRLEVVTLVREDGEEEGAHYLRRNRVVLDRGPAELLAFPGTGVEQRRGSGTWATVREARRRGMLIYTYPLDGSPSVVEPGARPPAGPDREEVDDPGLPRPWDRRVPAPDATTGEPGYLPSEDEYR